MSDTLMLTLLIGAITWIVVFLFGMSFGITLLVRRGCGKITKDDQS